MKRKFTLVTALTIALFGVQAHALHPLNCPDVSSIISVGVSHNTIKLNNAWIAGRRNMTYGTTDHWTFILGNVSATDSAEAYMIASAALPTLSFQGGPILMTSNRWLCVYNTTPGYPAIAVTPALQLLSAAHYLN